MARPTTTELLDAVLDAGSFVCWDAPVAPPEGYAEEYAAACAATGRDESVTTGSATVRGRRLAVVAGDPLFLGGSIGVASAERLTAALERATREGLPVLALPVGGGTRMQEGTVAFLQMATVTQAVLAHKAARLPYLVYLRHPTMGGVFASWGSLGHVQLAEPEALIGFLGPRVYEALYGRGFPRGVQLAENLQRLGIVDAVVPLPDLAGTVHRILEVLSPDAGPRVDRPDAPPEPGAQSPTLAQDVPTGDPEPPDAPGSAWASVERTRRSDRPGVRDLMERTATHVTMLNGTGDGAVHPGSVLALARMGGLGCVVLGQCRQGQAVDNPLGPEALREARRGMRLAAELGLPLVTLIDTPGAALSQEAEEAGLAGEIARTLADLVGLQVPTVSVLLGQGTGGIALALVPCDRILATRHAWLAPLPPEGASAIVHRDTAHAAELAEAQGVAAPALRRAGIVDRIIPEPTDAAAEPDAFCSAVAAAIVAELGGLLSRPDADRLVERRARLRHLGRL